LTYGLNYSWQTPYTFANQEQALLTDASNGNLISALQYIQTKANYSNIGVIYNPTLAFVPIAQSKRSTVYNTDYGDVAPRVSAAWNPSADHGILGTLFGQKKTVLRGGFGVFYGRLSSEIAVVSPGLTAGPNSTITTGLTNCAAAGTPGSGCVASANANPAQSVFRVGVDGNIPTPTYPATIASPYIPAGNYSELISFGIDPYIKMPRIYSTDFTLQRDIGKGNILEVGWNGRYGRRLLANVQISASPYFFNDRASGQTFAQAFDAVSNELRAGQPVTVQPFFENQLPNAGRGAGFSSTTAFLANRDASFFTNGQVSNLFDSLSSSQPGLNVLRTGLGLQPYDEQQINEPSIATNLGWSNYNALVVTLKHTGTRFTYDVNYTFSKSLDTSQGVQNDSANLANPLYPAAMYGPSRFDHRHILNAMFVYNTPNSYSMFPKAVNAVLGGWYVSGIVSALSGAPLYVTENAQVWGGGQRAVFNSPAVPTVSASSIGTGVNNNVAGSGGIGTTGNPATGGSGLNIFSNPQAVYSDFTFAQISTNLDGTGHPLRGLPYWNVDTSFGKKWPITERVSFNTSFDFYNLFNHPNFTTPTLNLTGSTIASFGVITSTLVPANRQASSRWIMFGARLEF
ncbi:MAG: hypothetical protein JO217_06515, partial [Acidobacteriaceae bacterium]|nr:hypothetical protein [Acidobacteriaceae bacterium]